MKRIGIDVGGVILHRDNTDFGKSHLTRAGKHTKKILEKKEKKQILEAPFLPHAKETISLLAESRDKKNDSPLYQLFIVSYCKSATQEHTRKILRTHGFMAWIPESNWLFVDDRKDKAKMCANYGLDMMIDDRYDVLENIRVSCASLSVGLWWFGGETRKKCNPKHMIIVKDWLHVQSLLRLPNCQ